MIGATVKGIPELKAALASIVPKLRRQAIRTALAAGARVVRDAARRRAPVLSPSMRTPYREPGTVRRAIVVRTSKLARRKGDVGVFVNVKPLPGAKYKTVRGLLGGKRRVLASASQRSAKNPKDPFYWRFLEFGTKFMAARPFLQPATGRLNDALQVFIRKIGPQIQKMNRKGAPAP